MYVGEGYMYRVPRTLMLWVSPQRRRKGRDTRNALRKTPAIRQETAVMRLVRTLYRASSSRKLRRSPREQWYSGQAIGAPFH